jgi:quercetin dioxygenase-like cupin family protein
MAFMEIAPRQEGAEHQHPFDQCGIIVEGEIEMSIGEKRKNLGPMEAYFIPAGANHHWTTTHLSAKILDVVLKKS